MEENNFENSQDQNLDNQQGGETQQTSSSEFKIPEEYQQKGWAKFFEGKSGDELKSEFFRSYDNSQSLIGKKVEDYIAETDLKSLDNYEQIKEKLSKQIISQPTIPQNAGEYDFNDILKDENGNLKFEYPQDVFDTFGETFKNLNITKEQGQGILKAYTDFEVEQFNKYTNAEELEANLKDMFNETTQTKSPERVKVETLLKEFIPKEDQEFLQKTAPNYTVEMFYRVAKNFVDKFGYKEGTSNSANPATKMRMTDAEKDAEYNRLYQKLMDFDNNPNQKVGERDEIVKQMRRIFE